MNGVPLILADLDDTLFQTRGKCGDWADKDLTVMSSLKDGSPSGYATPRQRELLRWLQIGDVVPVTARSREVMQRVNIAQAPAICANGGCILTAQGEPDQVWHRQLEKLATQTIAPAQIHQDFTAGLSTEEYRHWVVSEGGLELYVVIKSNRGDEVSLHALGDALAQRLPEGWRIHANGNNLAFLPPWLGKRQAVEFMLQSLRAEAPERLVIGIGDSHSDAGYIDLCDIAMMPTGSQLWADTVRGNSWVEAD